MLPICPGCGVVAPTSRRECGACRTAFGPSPLVAPGRAHGGMALACVHAADFACRACGARSPVATVDASGQIECMGCGLRQAFDVVQWKDALLFAHGVGDLSGPNLDPVSARSRHASIGSAHTSSTKTQNGMIMDASGTRHHSLSVTVSPGHPLCKTCRVPLDVWIEGPTAKTRCGRCGDAAAFGLPEGASAVAPALRGVLANEQRIDRPLARLGRTGAGVESIVCPQCGAGISAGGGAELVTCTYCNLAVRIPGPLARQQARGALPKMDPFWLVFEGPSIGRQRLAAGRAEDPDDDDEPAAAPPMQAWGPAAAAPMPWATAGYAPPRPGGRGMLVAILVLVVVLLAAGGVGAAYWLMNADAPAPTGPPAKKHR